MAVELEMPELAESVIEGEIVKWLVKEGEHVAQDQPLVEVMTDKVTVEVPSPYEGILLKQVAAEGAVVPIGKPIAIFGKEGETLGDHAATADATTQRREQKESASKDSTEAAPRESTPQEDSSAKEAAGNGQAQTAPPPQNAPAGEKLSSRASATTPEQKAPRGNGQPYSGVTETEKASLSPFGRPLAAPAIRKLARELGVNLAHVRGSGDGGRIRREDVERVSRSTKASAPRGATPRAASAVETGETEQRVPLRGLRRVIADHMVHSKHTAAHTLHVDEVDLTELVAMRSRAKEAATARGVKLTYLPFFVKAACAALKKYPYVNASLDENTHEVVLKQYYNIGIAANTDEGLVVPVIHHADQKTIFQLAADISELADRARHAKLSHDDISGGTFTITNVGSVGGLFTFPVINYPEVAILGTHSIQQRPVVRDGSIVIRSMMYLALSFDHRVVDGALAATFVKDVAASLGQPDILLMEGG